MTTTILNISGMSCEGCTKSVQNALFAITGVTVADVTLNPAQAVISYDDAITDITAIISAIDDAGFDVVR